MVDLVALAHIHAVCVSVDRLLKGEPKARLALLVGILEDRRYVPRSVQDPQDFEWPRGRIVDDEIREHWPELDGLVGEIVAQMADAGICRKELDSASNFSQHVACYGNAGVLDEIRLNEV